MKRRRRTKRTEGFTLIEVMMGVSIVLVGSLGIMALQQATTRGNLEARQMSIATWRTRTWIERVRRDALSFNQRGAVGVDTETVHLADTDLPANALWRWPETNNGESPAADFQGNDVNVGDPEAVYCTNIRTSWLDDGTIRVDVRTWWHRTGDNMAVGVNCDEPDAELMTPELDAHTDLRSVQMSSVVRWTPLS